MEAKLEAADARIQAQEREIELIDNDLSYYSNGLSDLDAAQKEASGACQCANRTC